MVGTVSGIVPGDGREIMMNCVCAMCEEYKQDQIGFEVADSGSVVCDDCYDIFIADSRKARAEFQREYESQYMAEFFQQKQMQADIRMIDEYMSAGYNEHGFKVGEF